MALTNVYVQTPAQLAEFFRQLAQGQAPDLFTQQHLKDLGFSSTNHRAFIPLLKALGFLSAEGKPTARYHDYRDGSQARRVIGAAVREAYSDLFVLRSAPTDKDRALFEGKFKSTHNVNDRLAKLMASTFYSLLALADIDASTEEPKKTQAVEGNRAETREDAEQEKEEEAPPSPRKRGGTSLHYNIQIHLPATKDIEVFNAIFKSLKEHLLD